MELIAVTAQPALCAPEARERGVFRAIGLTQKTVALSKLVLLQLLSDALDGV